MFVDEKKAQPQIGPGGYRCPCCGPAPSDRPLHRRRVRRRVKEDLMRQLRQEGLKPVRVG